MARMGASDIERRGSAVCALSSPTAAFATSSCNVSLTPVQGWACGRSRDLSPDYCRRSHGGVQGFCETISFALHQAPTSTGSFGSPLMRSVQCFMDEVQAHCERGWHHV